MWCSAEWVVWFGWKSLSVEKREIYIHIHLCIYMTFGCTRSSYSYCINIKITTLVACKRYWRTMTTATRTRYFIFLCIYEVWHFLRMQAIWCVLYAHSHTFFTLYICVYIPIYTYTYTYINNIVNIYMNILKRILH